MKKTLLVTALLLVGSIGTMARADTVVYSTNFDVPIDPSSQSNGLNTVALSFQ